MPDVLEPGASQFVLLESLGSNLGLTAPLYGISRGELPLSQPSGHLGYQDLQGQFSMRLLEGRCNGCFGARGSPGSLGRGQSSPPLGLAATTAASMPSNLHEPQEVRLAHPSWLLVGMGDAAHG